MWHHDAWDYGHDWWRNALQAAGGALGFGLGMLDDALPALLVALFGALYGTLLAGAAFSLREIVLGDRDRVPLRFAAYLGALLGFTGFFFLAGIHCGSARLLSSLFYAGLGAAAGAALSWTARRAGVL